MLRLLLLSAMVSLGCGADAGGESNGTGDGGSADGGSESADATGATTGLGGGPCDVGHCAGNVLVAIAGGATLADVDYQGTTCLVIEQEDGPVIELRRLATCEAGSVELVAAFRIPARIETTGFHDLGVVEAGARWSVANADPAVNGTYLAADDVTLSLSEYTLGSGGRITGNLGATVDAAAPLTATGQASVMFDIVIE